MNVLGRLLLNTRKDRLKTERRKDGVFVWDVQELTFLIIKYISLLLLLSVKAD